MQFSRKFNIRNEPIYFSLRGGLGNQLFGYFAGEYLRASYGHDVCYLPSAQEHGVFSHASSVNDLGLQIQEASAHPKPGTTTLRRQLYTLGARLGVDKRLLSAKLRLYRSEEVGFDSKLDSVSPGTLVEGYFQSYKYIDYVSEIGEIPDVSIGKPTAWLSQQITRVREERPIMVHVRRGDYRSLAATYGNLSPEYFLEGVAAIWESLGQRSVWVFSDNPDQVRSELGSRLPKSAVFISQPKDSPAAEALYLMSLGSGSVLSNSTFSWWSAKLRRAGPTVAPQNWFKELPEPLHLVPTDWIRIQSRWS